MNTIAKENQTKTKSNYLIAFILFGMYLTFGMSWMGVIPLLQEIEVALNIGHSQGAWLISIISMAKSVFPVLTGIVAARIGLTSTLRIASLLILTGAVVPFLPDYFTWLVARFLFGVGGAMWVTLMGAVTMQVFEPTKRPLINALNGVAVNIGVILALWFSLPLKELLGWQNTLGLFSFFNGIFALLLWFYGQIGSETQNNSTEKVKYTTALKMPITWIISISFTGPLALYLVFNTWLPIYFQDSFGIAKLQTMQWISWMNLWGIPAALATGFIIQIVKKTKPFIIIASVLLPLSALSAVNMNEPAILTIVLALTGVGMFLSISPLITLLQSQPGMTPSLVGMILGTMFSVTYILSSVVPGIIGYCYDLKMDLGVLLSASCLLAISPASALFIKEKS